MTNEISIADAMEILQVSKPTIYRLIHAGELHPIKKKVGIGIGGRRVWLDRKEVEALRTAEAKPLPKLDVGLGNAGLTERPPKTKPAKRGGK
jgi:excisionase family DNA binding protein